MFLQRSKWNYTLYMLDLALRSRLKLHPKDTGTNTTDEIGREKGRRLELEPSSIRSGTVCSERMQKLGETVFQYMSALKKLNKQCKLNEILEEHIRDKFLVRLSGTVSGRDCLKKVNI